MERCTRAVVVKPDQQRNDDEAAVTLHKVVARLPDRERSAIVLRDLGGRSIFKDDYPILEPLLI